MPIKKSTKISYRLTLALTVFSAILASVSSYKAFAGNCTGGAGVYSCSGEAATDTTQTLTGSPLQVTTSSGFSILTTIGDAINLIATNGLSFIDDFASSITATENHANAHAIEAVNTGTGSIVISTSGQINAVDDGDGINVDNNGTGAVTITTSGTIDGGDDGIDATNQAGTDLTITTTAAITGADEAIVADNHGSGALIINAQASLMGNRDEGLQARNHNGTYMTVNTADVYGDDTGIWAVNNGSGALIINATGAVTGTRSDGIDADNTGTDLTIVATTVTGEDDGIQADNQGSGVLSITTTGTVTGNSDSGTTAFNGVAGTDILINSAAIIAGGNGIDANNDGTGYIDISVSGTITAGDAGVFAENSTNGTSLTVNTLAINAVGHGIDVDNDGTGAIYITSTDIISSGDVGVFVNNSVNGTDVIINTVAVTGTDEGIGADNYGSGALVINATGTITGDSDEGIDAENNGTDLTITTAAVVANDDGIAAVNNGTGKLTVTSTGSIVAGNEGIYAVSHGTDLTITTATVTGTDKGIAVTNSGSGSVNITTNGLVTGDNGVAIRLAGAPAGNFGGTISNGGGWVSNNSSALEMTAGFTFTGSINSSADITGGGGTAIDASNTTTDFTINQSGGTITGDILFGTGDIIYNITGGEVDGDIISVGTGTVNVDLGTGNTISFNNITNVEDYNIQSGTAIQLGDFSTAGTTTTIAQGATLEFNSVINGSGALVSHGNLAFTPGAQLIQTGTVTLENGSTITANLQGTVAPLTQQQYLSATTLVNNGVSFESNSLLYDIEGNIAGNIVQADTVVADLANLSNDYNASQFGAAMKSYVENGATDSPVVALANLAAGDINGFEQVSNILSPAVSGSIYQGSRTLYDENWRAVLNHQLTTSINEKNAAWAQVIDTRTGAKKRGTVEGFSGRAKGLTVGFDRQLGDFPSGISLSQGDTALTNKRALDDHIDVESTQLSLYSSYQGDNWFAYVNTSAAKLNYDFDRDDTANTSTKINAKSKGDLFGVDISVGFSKIQLESFSIQPLLSLRYSHLSVDDYQESGGLNSKVSYQNSETLSSNLQLHATMNNFTKGNWQMTPVAHAGWEHEFINDAEQANVSFSNQSYQQRGASGDRNLYNFGIGLQAKHSNGVKLGLQYSGALNSDSYQHSASANFQYPF